MPISLKSRELFKSYGNAADIPIGLQLKNAKNPNLPDKNWIDTTLAEDPSFKGIKYIVSPSGRSVIVNYLPRVVEYPYGFFHIEGKPFVDRFIITREEAMLLNILPLGTTTTKSRPDSFDGFPLDQPLGPGESIGSSDPFHPEEILMPGEDVVQSQDDLVVRLVRIESKLDQLLAR